MKKNGTRHSVFTKLNKVFESIMTVVFLLVMAIGVYIVMDTYYVFQNASENDLKRYKLDGNIAGSLEEISDDAIGWLTIDQTKIDYPIMQADNNTEYLNKDPKGEYSLAGSIFMDYRNRPDFSNPYSLIYGHHMTGGYMFGALDEFADADYFSSHRTGTIAIKDKTIPFHVVAFLFTDTNCEEVFELNAGTDYYSFLQENAMYYMPEEMTNHLVALTTCKDPLSTGRTALILALET